MNEATWAALAATLTLLGLVWTWVAFRRRGAVAALRALGFTTLPVAAWLTGTLKLATEVTGSVTHWATGLVFNPITWTGIGLGGFGLVLIVISGVLRDRQLGRSGVGPEGSPQVTSGQPRSRQLPRASSENATATAPVADDEDEIEAILKRRGIT